MTTTATPSVRRDRALWLQCACAALVALGAAYASYRHGREFAELDRIAGTNNYGRKVLRRWRQTGHFPSTATMPRYHVERPA